MLFCLQINSIKYCIFIKELNKTNKIVNFLDIKINVLTSDEIVEKILEFALNGRSKMITYLNANCVNTAFKDEDYRNTISKADIVWPDGKGVGWALGFLGRPANCIHTLDFLDKLLEAGIEKNISFYLLGGKEAIIERAARNLKKRFPTLNLLGFHHGYFTEDESRIIEEINTLKPNILMIGMGVPKQEKWIYNHLDELEVNLYWAVGALFDILAGFYKRAPAWMINSGLEWFYRLCREPKRLWKRYLIGNFVFIYYVLSWKIKKLFFQRM